MNKVFTFAAIFVLVALTAPAKDDKETKKALQEALGSGVNFVKVRNYEIQTQGTKYLLNLENVHALPLSSGVPAANLINVRTGERSEKKSFMTTLTTNDNPNLKGSVIKKNGTVGIYAISSDLKHNTISIVIIDLEGREAQRQVAKSLTNPGGPSSVTEYLCASLTFDFDGSDLSSMQPGNIMKAINQWLVPLDKPVTPTTAVQPVGENREVPAGNSTADLTGKSVDELVTLLGKDYTTVSLGTRTIYIWKELGVRIPVENGKAVKP